jgi:hypothetical protein
LRYNFLLIILYLLILVSTKLFSQSNSFHLGSPLIIPRNSIYNLQTGYVDRVLAYSVIYLPIPNIGIIKEMKNKNSYLISIGNTVSLRNQIKKNVMDSSFTNKTVYDGFNLNFGYLKNADWGTVKSNHGIYTEFYVQLPQNFKSYSTKYLPNGFLAAIDTFYTQRASQTASYVCFANNISIPISKKVNVIGQFNVGISAIIPINNTIKEKVINLNNKTKIITVAESEIKYSKNFWIDFITMPSIILTYKL